MQKCVWLSGAKMEESGVMSTWEPEITTTLRLVFTPILGFLLSMINLAPTHLLDVMTSDDLDPTHISMLNQDFLRTLFVLEGFKRRADLEQAMDWRQYGRVLVYERA